MERRIKQEEKERRKIKWSRNYRLRSTITVAAIMLLALLLCVCYPK